jgi:hypothetical protein
MKYAGGLGLCSVAGSSNGLDFPSIIWIGSRKELEIKIEKNEIKS